VDDKEVGEYWDKNAENWTKLARMGYDRFRNIINSPAFFKLLPDVANLHGLDIGCGEGYNTRKTAKRGAKMDAIDISEVFIKYAKESEQLEPLGIEYRIASATELPFSDNYFDFAIATMSIMDMADHEKALLEAYRVIKFGGFFQFSMSHPCFSVSESNWVRNEQGKRIGLIVGNYFEKKEGEIEEWIFGAAPEEISGKMRKFRVPRFYRTLSEWLNLLIKTGFIMEKFCEPYPDDKTLEQHPEEYGCRIIPYSLIIRCRKA
jgi:ubiquinone/menaquinone biosynthesis C-methylase UbiE